MDLKDGFKEVLRRMAMNNDFDMDKKQAYEILKDSEVFGAVELYQEKEIEAFKIALEVLKENIDLAVEAEKESIGE